jgi:myotubularin-related protein 9
MKYPFFYKISFPIIEDGWNIYSIREEFDKLPLESNWRLTTVNKDFKLCSTYGEELIVPNTIDDSMLKKASEFRAGGRFPVLCYYHLTKQTFLMRSSQPMLGTSNRRCKEDEFLLKKALPSGKKGLIFDTRDLSVAKSATSKGGGYETDDNYPLWKRRHFSLERFDQLYVSLAKLIDATNDNDKWLSKLESSGWLNNVRQALHLSALIADELHNKNSCVLIHGSDGTDNTLLVSSLVQLILNKEYRTLKGFQMLIDKEWLLGGHPFSRRYFKSAFGQTNARSEGPVFVLFLDCVWQLQEQYKLSFEFNENYLIFLFDNLYASEYGTFLCNSEKERSILKLRSQTCSLWSFVNSSKQKNCFKNVLFEENSNQIWPLLSPLSINLWNGLYLRHQQNNLPLDEAHNEIEKLKQRELELNTRALELRELLFKR